MRNAWKEYWRDFKSGIEGARYTAAFFFFLLWVIYVSATH